MKKERKKGPFLLAQSKCYKGFYSFPSAPFSAFWEQLITILIHLFASFNGFILKQVMKKQTHFSTNAHFRVSPTFSENIYTGMFVHISGTYCCTRLLWNQTRLPLFSQHNCQNGITSIIQFMYLPMMFNNVLLIGAQQPHFDTVEMYRRPPLVVYHTASICWTVCTRWRGK